MITLADLFVHPVELSSHTLWMVIPVSLAVAIVYKTLRTRHLRNLPRDIALLGVYMLAGMGALMLGIWAIVAFAARHGA